MSFVCKNESCKQYHPLSCLLQGWFDVVKFLLFGVKVIFVERCFQNMISALAENMVLYLYIRFILYTYTYILLLLMFLFKFL